MSLPPSWSVVFVTMEHSWRPYASSISPVWRDTSTVSESIPSRVRLTTVWAKDPRYSRGMASRRASNVERLAGDDAFFDAAPAWRPGWRVSGPWARRRCRCGRNCRGSPSARPAWGYAKQHAKWHAHLTEHLQHIVDDVVVFGVHIGFAGDGGNSWHDD